MPIFTGVGSPGTLSIASGGSVLAFNNINTTTPVAIVGVDPARTKITFHNPGAVDVFIFPASVNTGAQDVPFVPTIASPGGGFVVFANGGTLVIDGECQKGWQALSRTGSSQPLTVMVSHVV